MQQPGGHSGAPIGKFVGTQQAEQSNNTANMDLPKACSLAALHEDPALTSLRNIVTDINESAKLRLKLPASNSLKSAEDAVVAATTAAAAADLCSPAKRLSQLAKAVHSPFIRDSAAPSFFSPDTFAADYIPGSSHSTRSHTKSALSVSLGKFSQQNTTNSSAASPASNVTWDVSVRSATAWARACWEGASPHARSNAAVTPQHPSSLPLAELASISLDNTRAAAIGAAVTPALDRPITANLAAAEATRNARVHVPADTASVAANAAIPGADAVRDEASNSQSNAFSAGSAWSLSDPVGPIPTSPVKPVRFAAIQQEANLPEQQEGLIFAVDIAPAGTASEQPPTVSPPMATSEASFSALLGSAASNGGVKFWNDGVQTDELPASSSAHTSSAPEPTELSPASQQAPSLLQLYAWQQIKPTTGFNLTKPGLAASQPCSEQQPCREVRIKAVCHPDLMPQGRWQRYRELPSAQPCKCPVTGDGRTFEDRYPCHGWGGAVQRRHRRPDFILDANLLQSQTDYQEGGRQEGRQSRGARAYASPAGPAHAAHQAQLPTSGVTLSVHAEGLHAAGLQPSTETDASGFVVDDSRQYALRRRAAQANLADAISDGALSLQAWQEAPCASQAPGMQQHHISGAALGEPSGNLSEDHPAQSSSSDTGLLHVDAPALRPSVAGASQAAAATTEAAAAAAPASAATPTSMASESQLQRMKKRRTCKSRLQGCQPARHWWQLLTG